jgi:hypothetical protein
MDTLITIDEVTTLLAGLPSLQNVRPSFENIRVIRRFFEKALQRLPCPQSTLHGWKGLVMARPLYALIVTAPFRRPIDPGPVAVYVNPIPAIAVLDADGNRVIDNAPLTRPEIATINAEFLRRKTYYRSMVNIERAYFDAVDACINDAFKVLNDVSIVGWHAGMTVMVILDGLSDLYGICRIFEKIRVI